MASVPTNPWQGQQDGSPTWWREKGVVTHTFQCIFSSGGQTKPPLGREDTGEAGISGGNPESSDLKGRGLDDPWTAMFFHSQ